MSIRTLAFILLTICLMINIGCAPTVENRTEVENVDVTVIRNAANGSVIAQDNDKAIYYILNNINKDEASIYKRDRDGSETLLNQFAGYASSLNADEHNLYFTLSSDNGETTIWRMDHDGKERFEYQIPLQVGEYLLAYEDDIIVQGIDHETGRNNGIGVLEKNDGEIKKFIQGLCANPYPYKGSLYYIEKDCLNRFDRSSGSSELVSTESMSSFLIANNKIFYINGLMGLSMMNLDGGQVTDIKGSGNTIPNSSLCMLDQYVIFSDKMTNRINRVNVESGKLSTVWHGSNTDAVPDRLFVIEHELYYTVLDKDIGELVLKCIDITK